MKKIVILIAAIGMTIAMSGCGQTQETAEVTTIEIAKDGMITHTIVGEFNEEIYNAQDLTQMIQDETARYNEESGGNKIAFLNMEVEDGRILLKLQYTSAEDYQTFNQKILFVGTIAEAANIGYDLGVTLKNQNGQTISGEEVSAMGDSHMVIMEEPVNVKVFGKILYFSENMEAGKDKNQMAAQADTEQPYYLVFK